MTEILKQLSLKLYETLGILFQILGIQENKFIESCLILTSINITEMSIK